MDMGPPPQRRETSRKRVSSPSAANSGAEPIDLAWAPELCRLSKILLDHSHHHAPASLVRRERLCPALERDLIEAGLRDGQHDAVHHVLQREHDERGRLGRVIDAWLNGVGMPPEGEQPFGLHLLDSNL